MLTYRQIGRLIVCLCVLLPGAASYAQDSSGAMQAAIAAAVSKRRINEAKALLLDRNLDQRDVQLLADEEIDVRPVTLDAIDKPLAREPSSLLSTKVIDAHNPEFRYRFWARISDRPPRGIPRSVTVDPSLAPPQLSIDLSDAKFPVARVAEVQTTDGSQPLYYFEFDTSPSFTSPNFWAYPALQTFTGQDTRDLTARSGLELDAFNAMQRNVDGRSREIRFPFRATAMRLPVDWNALTYEEMKRHALALGYGLEPAEMIGEIQRYGVHSYLWSDDNLDRPALDTFRSGLGECAAVNNLIGTLLELNGLRYRIVSGFNPRFRVLNPQGGHTAIEVYDPKAGQWSYVDSYLDLYLPGRSAETLAGGNDAVSGIGMTEIRTPNHQAVAGKWLTLGQLFKFRTYSDGLQRLPATSMLPLQAGPGEWQYGTSWNLNVAEAQPPVELFPEQTTIHVRARYVLAGSRTVQPLGEPATPLNLSDRPVASPWATARFEIAPRALMSADPVPKQLQTRNACEHDQDLAKPLTGPFKRELGHAYTIYAGLPQEGDSSNFLKRSPILLCEDGMPLGPAHALHDDIRSIGQGRYSHWQDHIYLSTSDNSDPNTNGRTFSVIDLDLVRARNPQN